MINRVDIIRSNFLEESDYFEPFTIGEQIMPYYYPVEFICPECGYKTRKSPDVQFFINGVNLLQYCPQCLLKNIPKLEVIHNDKQD